TERFGTDRRTKVLSPDHLDDVTLEQAMAEEIANVIDEPCVVTLSQSGLLGREPLDSGRAGTFGRHDVLTARVGTTTHGQLWLLTNRGRVCPTTVMAVGEVTGRSRGTAIGELAPLDKGEDILAVVTSPAGGDEPPPLMLVTAQGVMKRISI
ncbi:MAG: hypothetical protein ACKOYM_00685, partial [Actinomycetes bacterium]